jgi:hypothetical protein
MESADAPYFNAYAGTGLPPWPDLGGWSTIDQLSIHAALTAATGEVHLADLPVRESWGRAAST